MERSSIGSWYVSNIYLRGYKSIFKPIVNIENHDTIGLLAIDEKGNISQCMYYMMVDGMEVTGKTLGDSPIIGAFGMYVDNDLIMI